MSHAIAGSMHGGELVSSKDLAKQVRTEYLPGTAPRAMHSPPEPFRPSAVHSSTRFEGSTARACAQARFTIITSNHLFHLTNCYNLAL